VSLSRRHSRSLPWSLCSSPACRGSARCRCRCGASTPRVRLLGSPPVAMTARQPMPHKASRPTGRPCSYGVMASSLSPGSPRGRRCCRASPLQRKRSPRPNLVHAERGSASLFAVAMMAVLLAITVGGVYVGSAVIARHRAQAAADLAAVAAAVHLADGTPAACSRAAAVALAMNMSVTRCVVEDLDVVVTVEKSVPVGRIAVGPARATARAGPVGSG